VDDGDNFTARRCVIPQKSALLINIAAEAWNQQHDSLRSSPNVRVINSRSVGLASHEARMEEMRTLDWIHLAENKAYCPVVNTTVKPCVMLRILSLLTNWVSASLEGLCFMGLYLICLIMYKPIHYDLYYVSAATQLVKWLSLVLYVHVTQAGSCTVPLSVGCSYTSYYRITAGLMSSWCSLRASTFTGCVPNCSR
jgi:hypothetical protein